MKDYRIEVKVKNNLLYKLMKKKGIESVAQLSRKSGVSLPQVYNYMNLKIIPYLNEKHAKEGEFKNSVLELAKYLDVTPYEMFPVQHLDKPLLTNKAESEMSFEEITQYILPDGDKPLLEDGLYEPEQLVFKEDKHDAITNILKTLTKNEETALRMYYGLDGPEKSHQEIGKYLERDNPLISSEPLTRERVRMIIAKALRKLRHKNRAYILRRFS